MKYFKKEFIQFFKDLEANNHKEWFHSNKKNYEEFVRKPMIHIVTDLVEELKKSDPGIVIDPKKCLGRINRDIRFSKDKTPYNIRFFAHITKGEKMDPLPVIAFRFGGKDAGIMAGFYNPNKDRLKRIRDNIKSDPKTFKKLYSAASFTEKFGSIQGDANKRIPPEYKELFQQEPLIANKQFYYVKEVKPNTILKDDLLPMIVDYWKAAKPLNDFLSS